MTPQPIPAPAYITTHEAIIRTINAYLDGVREGKSSLMRPAFHPAATYCGDYPAE